MLLNNGIFLFINRVLHKNKKKKGKERNAQRNVEYLVSFLSNLSFQALVLLKHYLNKRPMCHIAHLSNNWHVKISLMVS